MGSVAKLDHSVAQKWEHANLMEKDGILVPSNSPDESALLKARTLLAYLMDTNRLSYQIHNAGEDSMIVVRYSGVEYELPTELMDEMWATLNSKEEPTVAAVVMYRPFIPIHYQPGIAFLKSDIIINTLFNKLWLKSSLDWLRKRPQERVNLDLNF